MAAFEIAIIPVLKHEGGYVNDPNDNGGATNFGVSLRWLISSGGGLLQHPEMDLNHDGLLDWRDIQAMSKEEACALYKSSWWDANHYGDIADQNMATKVLDMSINMGPSRAHKLLQQALVSCGKPVGVDGVLGPQSFQAINQTDPANLMYVLCHIQANFYRSIVAHNPTQVKFLKGWIIRSAFQGS